MGWTAGPATSTITAVSFDDQSSAATTEQPAAGAAKLAPRDAEKPAGSAPAWAFDLVETTPAQLRKRRLRRIAVGAGGALVVAALVAWLGIKLFDPWPDLVINDRMKPHDAVLTSYLIPVPADAHPAPSEPAEATESAPADRQLDEEAVALATGRPLNLRRYKFNYGTERRWQHQDGTLVTVWLLRFSGARNTSLYLRQEMYDIAGTEEQRAVTGVLGGRSLLTTTSADGSDDESIALSTAPAGDVAVLVFAFGGPPEALTKLTDGVLAGQYALL
jgi:hypothetical protein